MAQPHSADFIAAWKALTTETFGWRTEGKFVRVRSLSGRLTLSYLPLLNYTDLDREAAASLAESAAGRHHQIRILDPDQQDLRDHDPVTLRLDLARRDPEDVWKGSLHSKCRNQVRKARKSPIITRAGRDAALIRDFCELLADTHHRYGMPMLPRKLFEEMPEHLTVTFYLADHDERPIAGLVAIQDRDLLWVPWAASDRAYLRFCPNHRIYWRAIRDALEREVRVFDFGRSPYGGSTYRFKTQWGAEPIALSVQSSAAADVYSRYHLAQRLWRSAPRALVDRVGPRLCKYLADF